MPTDRMSSLTLTRFRCEGAAAAVIRFGGRAVLAAHGVDAGDAGDAWSTYHPASPLDARIGAAWRRAYRVKYAALVTASPAV